MFENMFDMFDKSREAEELCIRLRLVIELDCQAIALISQLLFCIMDAFKNNFKIPFLFRFVHVKFRIPTLSIIFIFH